MLKHYSWALFLTFALAACTKSETQDTQKKDNSQNSQNQPNNEPQKTIKYFDMAGLKKSYTLWNMDGKPTATITIKEKKKDGLVFSLNTDVADCNLYIDDAFAKCPEKAETTKYATPEGCYYMFKLLDDGGLEVSIEGECEKCNLAGVYKADE